MEIPKDVKLYEQAIATFWFDEHGILHSISKQGPRSIDIMADYILFVKNLLKDEPVCILTDISKAGTMDKKTREFTATHLQKVYKAMAIISDTSLGNMIGRIFLQLDNQPYPTATFQDEQDAREWLRKFL